MRGCLFLQWARLAMCGLVVCLAQGAQASSITYGLQPADFDNPTIERFQGPSASVSSYDFGNGMAHLRLTPGMDWMNTRDQYGLGPPSLGVWGGREGRQDGFFGVGGAPSTYQLSFSDTITQFGFYGMEAWINSGAWGDDAIMHMEFYDASDDLIEAMSITTPLVPAWTQFHGFESDVPIRRVLWLGSGHMVLDDVHFGSGAEPVIPEPCTLVLLAVASGLAAARRRPKAGP